MSKEYFYVTTPIYYVNDTPHIGHTYTTIAADVISRYHKLLGKKTFFLTGTDEHGLKVTQAAQKSGKTPQKFCDEIAAIYKETWEKLGLEYDYFIRTTDEKHIKIVKKFLEILFDKGYIYKDKYSGLYCVGCEKYITKDELVDGLCPHHKTKPEYLSEENYFFALSKFQDKLIKLITDDTLCIRPLARKNEVLGKLKLGVEDISISRTNLPWGINLPFDVSQTIYVWIDALLNYISAIGFGDDEEQFKKTWPADVHLMAKDILWFHCVIWPAMLLAAELPLPKMIFIHGFFTVNGQKMSKSLGNIISPIWLAEKYTRDAISYFVLREATFGLDYDFSEEALKRRLNNDLANDLGNLLNRTTAMITRYQDGILHTPQEKTPLDEEIIKLALSTKENYIKFMNNLEFRQGLETVWSLVTRTNKYLEETAPWVLNKEKKTQRLNSVLYNTCESLRFIALMLYPFIPESTQKIWRQIGAKGNIRENNLNDLDWGKLPDKTKITKAEPLFPKME